MSKAPRIVKASAGPKRATLARLISIEFLSDHRDSSTKKMLRRAKPKAFSSEDFGNITTKLSDEGATEMIKPDWIKDGTSSRNDPITHTAGEVVKATLKIKFNSVPGGEALIKRIFSQAGNVAALEFDIGGGSRKAKTGEILTLSDIQSRGPLASIVGRQSRTAEWFVELEGIADPIFMGVSGPHVIYTTLDKPSGSAEFDLNALGLQHFSENGSEQIVTDARMEHLMKGVQGASNEDEVAERCFRFFSKQGIGYVLGRQWVPPINARTTGLTPSPELMDYLWMCAAREALGECHVIAAAFRLACRMAGVKASMDVGYMIPQPGRLEQQGFPRRTDGVKGRLNVAANRIIGGSVHPLAFFDQNGAPNRFEGVVTYKNGMYAIGDSIFDRFTSAQNGVSADDRNSTDYFCVRNPPTGSNVRSVIVDENAGVFDLAYVDEDGKPIPNQYPWPQLGRPSQLPDLPWRWED